MGRSSSYLRSWRSLDKKTSWTVDRDRPGIRQLGATRGVPVPRGLCDVSGHGCRRQDFIGTLGQAALERGVSGMDRSGSAALEPSPGTFDRRGCWGVGPRSFFAALYWSRYPSVPARLVVEGRVVRDVPGSAQSGTVGARLSRGGA